MKLRSEVMIQQILPVVRSFVAKELVFRYKMSQSEVAELLGITQPAVSQYLNNVRGKSRLAENRAVVDVMQSLARDIYERKADEAHFMSELLTIYKMVTADTAIFMLDGQEKELKA